MVHALGLTMSLWDFCILSVALGLKEEICQWKSSQLGRQLHLVSKVFLMCPALAKESIFSKEYSAEPRDCYLV